MLVGNRMSSNVVALTPEDYLSTAQAKKKSTLSPTPQKLSLGSPLLSAARGLPRGDPLGQIA